MIFYYRNMNNEKGHQSGVPFHIKLDREIKINRLGF